MQYLEFEIYGPKALFSDPEAKSQGEFTSYPVPTYGALLGILKNIYYKPSILWRIKSVRIMNEIHFHTEGVLLPKKLFNDGKNESDRVIATTLTMVRYKVRAYCVPNPNQINLLEDGKNIAKHMAIAKRYLERGGRRRIFLGKSDYVGFVLPTNFEEGEGFYDNIDVFPIGTMFHSYMHADEVFNSADSEYAGYLTTCFQTGVKMENGVIHFVLPHECKYKTKVQKEEITLFPNKKEDDPLALDETI